MAPILGVLVMGGALLIWGSLCLTVIIHGLVWKLKQRRLMWGAGIVLCLCIAAAFWFFRDDFTSPATKARSLVELPPEAHVVEATLRDWGGATIIFRLPPTKPMAEWMGIVWQMNVPKMAEEDNASGRPVVEKSPGDWTGSFSDGDGGEFELNYDKSTGLYEYEVRIRDND